MPLLATIPIILILILMVGFRWSAVKAGAVGYFSALLIAIFFFGANFEILGAAHIRATLLSLDVLAIIWAAYLLYRVSDEAGAINTIGKNLRQLTSDKGMQAILIGWVFASFLQGTGGFGVPVAITAPLLIGLGFSPLMAVVIPTVGHGWAVTFGSLGSSFNALISATGLDAAYLAPTSALFLGLSTLPTGLMIVFITNRETRKVSKNHTNFLDNGDNHDDFLTNTKVKPFKSALDVEPENAWRKLAWQAVIIGLVMGIVQYLVAVELGLWNIGSFAGGMAGLIVGVGIARWGEASQKHARRSAQKENFGFSSKNPPLTKSQTFLSSTFSAKSLKKRASSLTPLSAYLFLILFTGVSLLIPKSIFTHPGAILFYASLAAFVIYKRAGLYAAGTGKRILTQTARKMTKSSLSIMLMVAMAMIMQKSGMTEALAQGLANSVGAGYPLAAAWIGAIGAFMTGSNTNSNVVFAALQMRTAELLGYRVPIILAAQTAGAGLASVIAPAKLIVGASTAEMEGEEGQVMRAVIGYSGGLVLFISFLTVLGILFFE